MTRWPNIKVLPDGFRADLTECAHRNITEGVPSLAGAWPAKRTKPPNHPMHSISAALRTDFALHMACHCHNRSRKRNANVNAAIDLTIDPANDPEHQGGNCRTQAFFGEKWCMCLFLLGGGRIGAKLPETQTIFNAALTIAAQMLRAFQAFLVDNFYRVPRGPCHRQLASKQASQRQKYINQRLAIHRCHRWLCYCNFIIPAVLDSSKIIFGTPFVEREGDRG